MLRDVTAGSGADQIADIDVADRRRNDDRAAKLKLRNQAGFKFAAWPCRARDGDLDDAALSGLAQDLVDAFAGDFQMPRNDVLRLAFLVIVPANPRRERGVA